MYILETKRGGRWAMKQVKVVVVRGLVRVLESKEVEDGMWRDLLAEKNGEKGGDCINGNLGV